MSLTSRPAQKKTWAQKIAKGKQFFKDNIDYLISHSHFGDVGGSSRISKLKLLYEAYNSKYPTKWFDHVTNPFSSENKDNQSWPGKIRPANIIRPNIDYLRGEYPKRPFNFQVVVRGEDGYSQFMEAKKKTVYKNLSQIFINTVNEQEEVYAEQGQGGMDTGVESQEVQMPDKIVEKFTQEFKNILSNQAQTDLNLIMEDQKVKEKLGEMMKDWLIAGEAYSFKNVIRDEVIFERVSPLEFDWGGSAGTKYVRDGDWTIRKFLWTVGDVVDRFYDSIKASEIDTLENGSYGTSPEGFYNWLSDRGLADSDKVPVYHATWKSLKKIGVLTYFSPISGQKEQDFVDEDYVITPELNESVEWFWITEWLEGYRIADDIYVEMGPVRFQPNMINNLSKSWGPYNGARFSDTHADNLSPCKLMLPFQIMYIIANFAMERTLAKSRGKIQFIDKGVIPTSDGWDEEKFFHYAEAQGWAVIDRQQIGADKSYNQYSTSDLGLFDHIAELIKIMDFCKRQCEEQIGLTQPVKGQTSSADSATGIQTSVFQSSIITEMTFVGFEHLTRTDLEGLLDCSQIANVQGKRSAYVSDEGRTEILDINPEEYCYAQMGIFMSDSTKDNDALNKIRSYGQAFAQNGAPPSAIVAIETASNINQLKSILVNIENKQAEIERQSAESEQEARMNEIQLEQQFKEYEALLETQKMHEEYNRKEDLVLIQGDINMAMLAAEGGEEPDNGMAATEALMSYTNERDKIAIESERKDRELAAKVKAQQDKTKRETMLANHKMKLAEKDQKLKEDVKNKELKLKKTQIRLQAKKKPASK